MWKRKIETEVRGTGNWKKIVGCEKWNSKKNENVSMREWKCKKWEKKIVWKFIQRMTRSRNFPLNWEWKQKNFLFLLRDRVIHPLISQVLKTFPSHWFRFTVGKLENWVIAQSTSILIRKYLNCFPFSWRRKLLLKTTRENLCIKWINACDYVSIRSILYFSKKFLLLSRFQSRYVHKIFIKRLIDKISFHKISLDTILKICFCCRSSEYFMIFSESFLAKWKNYSISSPP